MDTNPNLTAAKASVFFRKRTIISQLRQQVQKQILKEGPILISSLTNTREDSSPLQLQKLTCFSSSSGQQTTETEGMS